LNSIAVICVGCGAGNPDANTYCGECGNPLARRSGGIALHPGFKGPRRLLIASSVVFAMSVAIAATAFLLIQESNPASVGLDFGGPIVNALLDAANVTSVRAPGSPSDAVAFLLVGTFLLAAMLAIASTVAGMAGGIWLLARWRDSGGPSRVGTAIAGAGEAGRKGLGDAHRLGAESLEKAKPRLTETAERSREVAEQARDGAAERFEDMKPVVRRVARQSRATFSEEVAPRVSTGFRKGVTRGRRWISSRRDKDGDGSGS
jgi:hypothetical protein